MTLDAGDGEGSGIFSTVYKIYNSTYDSGWITYTESFYLTALANGTYTIEYVPLFWLWVLVNFWFFF